MCSIDLSLTLSDKSAFGIGRERINSIGKLHRVACAELHGFDLAQVDDFGKGGIESWIGAKAGGIVNDVGEGELAYEPDGNQAGHGIDAVIGR